MFCSQLEENITSYFFIRPGDNEWSAYTIQKFTSKQNQPTTHRQWSTAIESHMHWQGSTMKFCGCNSYSCNRQSVGTTNALAQNQTRIQSEYREHWTDIGDGDEKELNSFWVFCMRRSYVHANCQFTYNALLSSQFAVCCCKTCDCMSSCCCRIRRKIEKYEIASLRWVRCSRKWNRIFCQCFALIRAPTSHTAILIHMWRSNEKSKRLVWAGASQLVKLCEMLCTNICSRTQHTVSIRVRKILSEIGELIKTVFVAQATRKRCTIVGVAFVVFVANYVSTHSVVAGEA